MTKTLTSLAVLVALIGALLVAPLSTRAAESSMPLGSVPVTGSKNDGTKKFDGTWKFTRMVAQGDALFAEGELTGEVTNKKGKTTHTVAETVLLPASVTNTVASAGVRAQAALCDVLHLELAPITLSLLGLNLFIGGEGSVPIVIDITADEDAGILGGLLCALAGGAPLSGLGDLTAFLNALTGLLQLLG